MAKAIGRLLNEKWSVGAQHALFSKSGNWYHTLERFPGALFDENGYIKFESREAYEACAQLHIGKELNVQNSISSLPGYVRVTPTISHVA